MRPIRVLFAIPALDHGGPDRVMFEILSAIDRDRFAPSIMVSEPKGAYLSRLPPDIPIEALGSERGLLGRYPVVRALHHVRRMAPDVIFATLRMQMTLGLAVAGFPRGTRLVVRPATPHSLDFAALAKSSIVKHRVARRISVATLRRADAVICQSESMRLDLGAVLGESSKLHVIGNPIDVEAVARVTAGTRPKLPGDPALVSVGRFWPVKGYDILLEALPAVRDLFPNLHLTIIAFGPERERLQDLAARLDLASSVTFNGFDPEPLPSVRAADLFVLASRYEGFPNAALEALACGTPVVLTDCAGANSQIVRPSRNGQLAARTEPREVASAIITAIQELDRYDRLAIVADTNARFGVRRVVSAYEKVFSDVVGRGERTSWGTPCP